MGIFDSPSDLCPEQFKKITEEVEAACKKPTKEELLNAFNSGETVEDGLEEVFRLGQERFLAK